MVSKIIQIFYLIIICNLGFSQTNLVTNGGFENHSICPTFMLQWDRCIGWLNCNGNIGNGLWGTPDYFHTCGTTSLPYNPVPPNTGNGYCNPHNGSAMMGLVCYNLPYPNYREYISTALACPMTSGNTYTVSFWITASSAPAVKYNSSHFGVYLSSAYPVQSSYLVMNLTPQYEITTIVNNTTWQQHTFTITPTTNLNYITLGCFRTESVISSVLATSSASQPYSNYFIDDIEVLSSASSGTVSMSSSATNIKCFGAANGSATVTATGSGNNYLWSPGNYTTASVSNLSAGIYTVNVNNGGCSSNILTVNVTQPPIITSSMSAVTSSICIGQSVILNSINSGGIPSYTVNWNNGIVNTSSISVSPISTSVYSYTVTDSNLCTKSSSISIIVNPTPTININTQNICSGVPSTLTVSGASSYLWVPGNISGSNNIVNLSNSTIYTVTGTSSVNCSAMSTFTIGVNQTPTVVINSNNICVWQTATLSAISSNNTYSWLPGGQMTASITVNPNATTNYSVISSINTCSSIAVTTVSVYPLPIILTTTNVAVCLGQIKILNAIGANTYTWQPGNSNGNSISITPLSNTQYTVFGESANGCINNSIISVNTANSLTVDINSAEICEGNQAFLIANTNGNQYHWEPSSLAQSPNNNATYVNPMSSTIFTFQTSENGNCITTATVNVIVNKKPVVFAGLDTVIEIGESFVLIGSGSSDFGWKSLDGSELNCNYCSSVTISPQQNTCYVLESKTDKGCMNKDTICITVLKDWDIYIPNAFTPNNDLKNDVFLPYGFGIQNYELYIFDRWGEQIFKSDTDHKGWNGYYKNYICEMGVYTYMIIINTFSKQEEKKIGHVTLLK